MRNRGEVATMLTVISVGLMILGAVVGTQLVRTGPKLQSSAMTGLYICKLDPGGCKSNDDGTLRFCYNECIPGDPGYSRPVSCKRPLDTDVPWNPWVVGPKQPDAACGSATPNVTPLPTQPGGPPNTGAAECTNQGNCWVGSCILKNNTNAGYICCGAGEGPSGRSFPHMELGTSVSICTPLNPLPPDPVPPASNQECKSIYTSEFECIRNCSKDYPGYSCMDIFCCGTPASNQECLSYFTALDCNFKCSKEHQGYSCTEQFCCGTKKEQVPPPANVTPIDKFPPNTPNSCVIEPNSLKVHADPISCFKVLNFTGFDTAPKVEVTYTGDCSEYKLSALVDKISREVSLGPTSGTTTLDFTGKLTKDLCDTTSIPIVAQVKGPSYTISDTYSSTHVDTLSCNAYCSGAGTPPGSPGSPTTYSGCISVLDGKHIDTGNIACGRDVIGAVPSDTTDKSCGLRYECIGNNQWERRLIPDPLTCGSSLHIACWDYMKKAYESPKTIEGVPFNPLEIPDPDIPPPGAPRASSTGLTNAEFDQKVNDCKDATNPALCMAPFIENVCRTPGPQIDTCNPELERLPGGCNYLPVRCIPATHSL